MDIVVTHELERLMKQQPTLCVSLFMPTHRSGMATEQDPIRFRNLVNRAEEMLIERGMRSPQARKMLEEPRRLLREDAIFWRTLSYGLAVFVGQDLFLHYRLPREFETRLEVNDHFHLRPLLPVLSNNGMYYALILSLNGARLFQCTRHAVQPLPMPEAPRGMADALRATLEQNDVRYHSSRPGHGSQAPARGPGQQVKGGPEGVQFHGMGIAGDDVRRKKNISECFRQLNDSVMQHTLDHRWPLVLAGVDYLREMFNQTTSYPHLLEQGASGNPDRWSEQEVQARTWPIVEPFYRQEEEKAENLFYHERGTNSGKAAQSISEVVKAACQGRVQFLFADETAHVWGRCDQHGEFIDIHPEAMHHDQDLLDVAAAHTLMKDGTVYVRRHEHMPDGAAMAALLRY